MKTKNGIYTNLDESEYKVEFKEIIFYFSSKLYLDKFINLKDKYIDEELSKIQIKYKVCINQDLKFELIRYLAVSLYAKIEKRGFKINKNIR